MGAVSGLGNAIASGAKGVGKTIQGNGGILGQEGAAPTLANIQQATSIGDVQNAQKGVGNSLQSQQQLLEALQKQGGLGMQNTAANNQLGLANQLQGANGVGVQQGAISGLQNTAGMYQNIANGTGPNPAQAMLNQATGQNVANQAALMAGQRGAGANVGLMARQAAQQGAATQQQAVGQGATMQANQQLNALSGLSGTQQAIGGMGSNLVNQQGTANNAYANQANQIAGQQIGATTANTQANLANQQQAQNALQGTNNAFVGSQTGVNAGNVDLSKANSAAKQGILGGVMNAAGAAFAEGGPVGMADGGNMTPLMQPNMSVAPPPGPSSDFGQFMNNQAASPTNNIEESEKLTEDKNKYDYNTKGSDALKQGTSKLLGSLGAAAMAAKGGMAKSGGAVKAKSSSQKAEKEGDSYKNDKIKAVLSEHEIVLPRSVTLSDDPVGNAAKFVQQALAKRKVK